jgi:hypothetical protein
MKKTFKPAKATIALSVIAALAGGLSALGSRDRLASLWRDDAPPVASAQRPDSTAPELRSNTRDADAYAPNAEHVVADKPTSAATSPPIPMVQQPSQYQRVIEVDGDKTDASNTESTDTPPETIFMTGEEAIEQERIQQETFAQQGESDSAAMSSPTAEEEVALKEHEENLRAAAAAAEAMAEASAGNNTVVAPESN